MKFNQEGEVRVAK